MESDKLIGVKSLSERLGVKEDTVRNYIETLDLHPLYTIVDSKGEKNELYGIGVVSLMEAEQERRLEMRKEGYRIWRLNNPLSVGRKPSPKKDIPVPSRAMCDHSWRYMKTVTHGVSGHLLDIAYVYCEHCLSIKRLADAKDLSKGWEEVYPGD